MNRLEKLRALGIREIEVRDSSRKRWVYTVDIGTFGDEILISGDGPLWFGLSPTPFIVSCSPGFRWDWDPKDLFVANAIRNWLNGQWDGNFNWTGGGVRLPRTTTAADEERMLLDAALTTTAADEERVVIRVFDAMLAVCEAAGDNQVALYTETPTPGRLAFTGCDKELWVEFTSNKRCDVFQKHTARFNNGEVHVTCLGSFDTCNWERVVFRDAGQSEREVVDFLKEWLGQVKA